MLTDEGLMLSRDQLIEYYEWWAGLRESGAVSSAEISVSADANQNSPIINRQVAMLPVASGSIGQFLSNSPDELTFVPFPTGQNPNDEVNAGVSLSVSADSDHIEQAVDFADFIINDVDAGMIIGTQTGIPTNSERRAALLASDLDPGSEMGFAHFQYLAENRELVVRSGSHPAEGEFDTRRFAEEQRLAFGRASVEETVDAVLAIARDLGIATR
jgi:multiple sugar transport system substrate-binding protein